MASVRGDVRSMYDGIKKAIGPVAKKTAPLKSLSGETITDSSHQMKRWIEHFSELYSRQTTISDTASNVLKDLPMMPELDNVPTLDELNKAIDALNCNKAPGNDSIPPEVIKRCKSVLLKPLHDLLCLCWKKVRCHKTCVTRPSLLSTKIKVTAVTATTTEASLSSVLLARFLLVCYLAVFKYLRHVSTLNLNVVFVQTGRPPI